MNKNNTLIFDDGYCFGMGVFETISVEKGTPLFLNWHLERLEKGLGILGISNENFKCQVNEAEIRRFLEENQMEHGVLKIMVSERNILFTKRENPYDETSFEKGFRLDVSRVIRNETSPFTYIKSFHHGDNLLEKRRCKKAGYEETLFLNSQKQITETSASNIFFVKEGRLFTPKISCGLLDGIMRRYILEHYEVEETELYLEDLQQYEEAFLTNSLMWTMPVVSIGELKFPSRTFANKIRENILNIK